MLKPADPPIDDIPPDAPDLLAMLSALRQQADTDTAALLAGCINLYTSALSRFRGNVLYGPRDAIKLLSVVQIILDVQSTDVEQFKPKAGRVG